MSLEEAARRELLQLRKQADGVTVASLARTEALRSVLGGGDPRVAYNTLKHIVLVHEDNLAVTAAAYSLGFASDAKTHLDRLSEFGTEYHYDQRHARRYSDKGIVEIARHIASEWTIEASPTLEVLVLRADAEVLEVYIRTERLTFIEMRDPLVEAVAVNGDRRVLPCEWHHSDNGQRALASTNVIVSQDVLPPPALSIRWQGEIWPRFVVETPECANNAHRLRIQTLAARVQLSVHTEAWEDRR